MGYAFQGACYPSLEEAVAAFQRTFPLVDNTGVTTHTGSFISSISSATVTYAVSWKAWGAASATAKAGSFNLQTCTATMEQYPMQSVFLVVALFFAAFFGFFVGSKL